MPVPGKQRALTTAVFGLALAGAIGAAGNGLQAVSDGSLALWVGSGAGLAASLFYLWLLPFVRSRRPWAEGVLAGAGAVTITGVALVETEAGTYLYLCFGYTYLATLMFLVTPRPTGPRAVVALGFLGALALRHAVRPLASMPSLTELVFSGLSGSVGVWSLSGWVQGVFDANAAALSQSQQERRSLEQANRDLELARDRALEASHAKDRFLANMSHELRTPINAIVGFAELLSEDPEVPRDRLEADLGAIRAASSHLLSLISAVLDLARIESGAVEVALVEVPLQPLVDDIAAAGRGLCLTHHTRFNVDSALQRPTVRTDPVKLRQILLNLLGNAAKFTTGGQVDLVVRNDADGLRVDVRDTGIGIPPERLGDVFERFVQVDASATRAHGGAGLGLALSRGLAWRLGGTLTATSEVGRGSMFSLHLPP
ncbi:MAG: HAMP domain-containing sensor histidine kinase [Myxococcota bacterium]